MRGVGPPERLGMNDEVFKLFLNGLRKHEINVIEEKSTG
jgi:hypothetical protein